MFHIIFCVLISSPADASAHRPCFTPEQREYMNKAPVLKVVSMDGIAPLSFSDSDGEIKGSDFDLYTNAEKRYAPEGLKLSRPYLESETILYINSKVDPKELGSKKFAAVKGGILPGKYIQTVELPFLTGETGVFKVVSSILRNKTGKVH